MVNIDPLTRLKVQIVANPQDHDQGTWGMRDAECGTVACAAGWTVLLNRPDVVNAFLGVPLNQGYELSLQEALRRIDPDAYVPQVARDILGLTVDQAHVLFYMAVTRAGVIALIDQLISTEGAVTPDEMSTTLYETEGAE